VGYDAGKKVKGRRYRGTADAIQDRDGAGLVLDKIRRRFPWLELIWADGGYNAWQVDAAVAKVPLLHMEIVKRSDDMRGFVVLAHPRLHPTGPQAARQGVGRDGGGLQSMVKRPSPTPGERRSRAETGRSDLPGRSILTSGTAAGDQHFDAHYQPPIRLEIGEPLRHLVSDRTALVLGKG
jgi:hypothetical protein